MNMNTVRIGGYHSDPDLCMWPIGSVWECEGEYLYHLVRKTRPNVIVAVGIWAGCSTTHLAKACINNDFGHIYAIDILGTPYETKVPDWVKPGRKPEPGAMIPDWARPRITIIKANALEMQWNGPIDFLFEDGEHTPGFTATILKNFPAAITACHDYIHPEASKNVATEANRHFGRVADLQHAEKCGIGVWSE